MGKIKFILRRVIIIFWGLLSFSQVFAQINQDTTKNSERQNPNLIFKNDTTSVSADSLLIREQMVLDSIALRQEFIRDSLIAREKFVKDSLYQRKQILDSLTFLQEKIPKLIDAAIKSVNEVIIIYTNPVDIIGDSTLSDFTYSVLSQKIDRPYAPWRLTIKLSGNSFKIKIDTVNKKVISLRSPEIKYSFSYDVQERIIRMNGRSTILKKQTGNYYKSPIDSVFFNREGRVEKIKKYIRYFEATKRYQKGALLYTDLEKVKEFNYFPDGVLSNYRVVNYCGRWSGKEKNEMCHSTTYSITRQGRIFTVMKKSEPKNDYADGTFIYEFDNNFDMKSMKFTNVAKSMNRNCIIELNKDRNVSRYLYEKDGRIDRTILVNYNNNPDAKYKVETILCYFEDDGISYYQKNTTTGKSRSRNKLTMKWDSWK